MAQDNICERLGALFWLVMFFFGMIIKGSPHFDRGHKYSQNLAKLKHENQAVF